MRKGHFISAQDGVKTFVLELIPDGAINGAPIICIHGLTRNHKDFEPIFDFLLGFGRKVYAIDVRGRGRSDIDPEPANYHPGTYMGDVANIMAQLGIENAIFIGTSMGGLISMLMAAFMPDKVKALVLNDVGPELNEEGLARIRQYVGKTDSFANWDEAIENIKAIAHSAFPLKADDSQFWLDFARRICKEENGRIRLDYDPAIKNNLQPPKEGETTPTLWPQFEMIKDIPIGVIRGAISDILTHDLALKMKATKPQLQIAEVANIGHAPILDEAPAKDLIAKTIEAAQ